MTLPRDETIQDGMRWGGTGREGTEQDEMGRDGTGRNGMRWGGNPMGCAVASTVLDIVSEQGVLQGVLDRRSRIERSLRELGEKYGVFSDVRGLGLLMGCVLTEPWQGKARDLMQAAQDEGVFVLVAGASVLRIAPSLIIPEEDIAEGLERLERAISNFISADNA